MKKQDKIFTVQNLEAKLKEAKSVILADYRGLTVSQIQQLRSLVKQAGGELTVVKNTLIARALTNDQFPMTNFQLQGPTAIAIAYEDELAPLKRIAEFARSAGMPSFKLGFWEGKMLNKEEVERLSLLPGKDELIRKLLGILVSPQTKLTQIMANNPKKLILILTKRRGVN